MEALLEIGKGILCLIAGIAAIAVPAICIAAVESGCKRIKRILVPVTKTKED